MIWTVSIVVLAVLAALGLLGYLCSRQTAREERDDEGTPWDWGDPNSPGYRPDWTKQQRIQAAAAWRAEHGESK